MRVGGRRVRERRRAPLAIDEHERAARDRRAAGHVGQRAGSGNRKRRSAVGGRERRGPGLGTGEPVTAPEPGIEGHGHEPARLREDELTRGRALDRRRSPAAPGRGAATAWCRASGRRPTVPDR